MDNNLIYKGRNGEVGSEGRVPRGGEGRNLDGLAYFSFILKNRYVC